MMNMPQFELLCFGPGQEIRSAVPQRDGSRWSCPELGLQFSCTATETEHGDLLRIPADSFQENGEYKFKTLIFHMPQFEAGEGSGSTLFIPWSSGLLCRTEGHGSAEYMLPVFGDQYQFRGVWGNMPLFGLSDGKQFRIGLLDEGKFDCGLRLRTAWGNDRMYSVDPAFQLRERSGEKRLDEDLSVLFTMVDGDWKQAAKWYRKYNLEVRGLKPIAERVKNEPDLDYSAKALTVRCRMAVKPLPAKILEQRPENEPEPRVFLTCDNVRTIAEEFRKQNVGPAEFNLVGWNHGGHDGAFPQLFPTAAGCGGDEALEALIHAVSSAGYHISLHDNYYDGYTLARNFDFDDVCRDGGPRTGGGRLGGGQAYQVCPAKAIRYAEENFREVKRRMPGLRGPYYVDVTTIIALRKCDHPAHPLTRSQNCRYNKQLMKLIQDEFGLSMSEGCRDWALPELDRSYLVYSDNEAEAALPFCDSHIPFFQMVYHGILLYNNSRQGINTFPGSRKYLENLAWGGLPMLYFHHIFNPDWAKSTGWANDLTFEGPDKLSRDVAVFKKMSDDVLALAPSQQSFMEDFIEHSALVSETVYSNGMRVFVNKGDAGTVLPDGTAIPPLSMVIKRQNSDCN